MSTLTTNYALIKPSLSDVADITNLNPNLDIIDTTMKQNEDMANKIELLSLKPTTATIVESTQWFTLSYTSLPDTVFDINLDNQEFTFYIDTDTTYVSPLVGITLGTTYAEYDLLDYEGADVLELAKGYHTIYYKYNGGAPFFVLAPRGGAIIKSVQRGTVSFSDGVTTKNITISSVNTAYTIVKLTATQIYSTSPNSGLAVKGEITSSTNLQLVAFSASATNYSNVAYEIIEYYPSAIKSFQKIVTTLTTVAISSVDLNKTETNFSWVIGSSTTSQRTTLRGYLQDSTTFIIDAGTGVTTTHCIYIVEFN